MSHAGRRAARALLLLWAILLVPGLPVACAGPAAADYGDRIIFGSIGEASNLIPYISTDSASHEVAGLLYVAPLRYDKNLKLETFAAERYSV